MKSEKVYADLMLELTNMCNSKGYTFWYYIEFDPFYCVVGVKKDGMKDYSTFYMEAEPDEIKKCVEDMVTYFIGRKFER